MLTKTNDKFQTQMEPFLSLALERAIETYLDYCGSRIDEKGFKEYHVSCKAAVSHIILLLKLVAMVSQSREKNEDDETLKKLIEAAQKQVNDYQCNDGVQ
jgi:hypothetical protein